MLHDYYYKDLSHLTLGERAENNFDHPDSLETDLMIHHIQQLKQGHGCTIPTYDFTTHSRKPPEASIQMEPRKIILIEGILILAHPELRKEMDIKVYVVCVKVFHEYTNSETPTCIFALHIFTALTLVVYGTRLVMVSKKDCDADVRLIRRLKRDTRERGRTMEEVLAQYQKTVRPMHEEYVEPSKKVADFIVPTTTPKPTTTRDGLSHPMEIATSVLKNHIQSCVAKADLQLHEQS